MSGFFQGGFWNASGPTPVAPPAPTLVLSALTANSFQAVMGTGPSNVVTLFYKKVEDFIFQQGPSVTGGGTVVVTTTPNANIIAYAIAFDGQSFSQPTLGSVSLAISDTVSGAWVKRWKSYPNLVAVCPQVWLDEIPELEDLPFAVLEIPEEIPEFQMENDYIERADTQLTVFARSAEEADSIVAVVKSVFYWQDLPFSVAVNMETRPKKVRKGREELRDKNGSIVFHRIMEFNVATNRSY